MSNETSVDLWRRCAAGDEDAAEQIYRRYACGLMALARQRLSSRLARRVDPEDVVQSAYRSFFLHGREGDYRIERSGDLWRLLAAITVKKLLGQVEHHRAQRRDFEREWAPGERLLERASRRPSAQDLAAALDELQAVMRRLSPLKRHVLELRLQDHTYEEIANRTDRSERTVRRWLGEVRQMLAERAKVGEEPDERG